MNHYDVLLYYSTPLSRRRRYFGGICASSEKVAKAMAEAMFLQERRGKPGLVKVRVTGATAVQLSTDIQNGDKITVPLTGRVEIQRNGTCVLHGRDGAKISMNAEQVERHTGRKLAVPITVEYLSLYPHEDVYRRSSGPVRTSQYGVENLIQIKVTRQGDQIIKKEFV